MAPGAKRTLPNTCPVCGETATDHNRKKWGRHIRGYVDRQRFCDLYRTSVKPEAWSRHCKTQKHRQKKIVRADSTSKSQGIKSVDAFLGITDGSLLPLKDAIFGAIYFAGGLSALSPSKAIRLWEKHREKRNGSDFVVFDRDLMRPPSLKKP